MKKIVAVGGGSAAETLAMTREIVRLTGKEKPRLLFLAHSKPRDAQDRVFAEAVRDFGSEFSEIFTLKNEELYDREKVQSAIIRADAIYETGGDTLSMIKLWHDSGFDLALKSAWESGKVMCGLSAGANCWFSSCSTDSLKILYGDDKPLCGMECLGFYDALFVPHCDEEGRYDSAKDILKERGGKTALLFSNCAALEIAGTQYRVIFGTPEDKSFRPYALKITFDGEKYYEEKIENTDFLDLNTLF